MTQYGARCPKCEYRNADGAATCTRCGHDMAAPFTIAAEQMRTAYSNGFCVSCRTHRPRWRSGAWRHCGKCAAPHCRSCWGLTAMETAEGRYSATRWLCLYCRKWNVEECEVEYW